MRKENGANIKLTPAVGGAAYFFLIACYLLLSLVGHGILNAAGVTDGVLFYSVSFFVPVIAASAVIIAIVMKSGAGLNDGLNAAKLKRTVGITPSAPVCFLAAILAGVGMIAGFGFINQLIANAMRSSGLNPAETNLPLDGFGKFALFTVFAALLPAAVEECFFRGLLLNCLTGGKKGNLKTDALAVFISALCFAVYHGSLAQIAYQFIYGALLAILTIKAGGILPAFTAHFMNNLAVLIISYARINVDLSNGLTIAVGLLLTSVAIALIFLCGKNKSCAVKCLGKGTESGGTYEDHTEKPNQKIGAFFFPFGATGIAVCAIMIICSAVAI